MEIWIFVGVVVLFIVGALLRDADESAFWADARKQWLAQRKIQLLNIQREVALAVHAEVERQNRVARA